MTSIQSIVEQLTLEEKAALCTGATAWTTTPVERLGVPPLWVSDGPHGIRRLADADSLAIESLPATCFPTASLLASTWDRDLIHEMGEALAEEAIAASVDVVLGPGANMKRTPVCGRNFEYFSEDPYLAGEMAAGFINGVQSRGVGTSLKHFAANNQEHKRMVIDAAVDERTLREIYLAGFETAVRKAQPWTVMCSYNKINGVYGSEQHRLLTEILKNEWGFEGFVVSDWGAVHDRVAALRAGLDLEMPGPRAGRTKAVVEAVRSGALDQALLDETARRVLRIVFKAAETPKGPAAAGTFDRAAHHALARRIAGEGMVLLKNDGILPLKTVRRLAVIGQAAQEPYFQGGGSSHINPTQVDSPLAELRKLAGGAEITFSEGYPPDDSMQPALIDAAVAAAREAEVALLYIALPSYKESEGYDRPDLDLTAQQVALIQAVSAAQPKSVVILNNGSAVTMSEWIDGPAAVLEAWMMGQAGGGAIADVLYGTVNPSGRLAETFPLRLSDTPAYINYPGEGNTARYGEGIFIGYRYYDQRNQPVLFPFGHGLSYTTFEYHDAGVSSPEFVDAEGLVVSVQVTNTGPVAGKEVVQVYVHDRKADLVRPPKELKGFAKVELQPGETTKVEIQLDFRSFAYYHPSYGQWTTEDGEFDILIGASAGDICCHHTVMLRSSLDLPSILDMNSTLREWIADRRGRVAIEAVVAEMRTRMAATFGEAQTHENKWGIPNFLMDMPLPGALEFEESLLPMGGAALVERLLGEVHG
jgi:beta-glucosidase